jgi:hypothetical protein
MADDLLGEEVIHGPIGVVVRRLEAAAGLQIVKERPDDLVGEAAVVVQLLLLGEQHGAQLVATIPRGRLQQRAHVHFVLGHGARPADPEAAAVA